ncbi:MAG TPA: hypothetical protein VD866_33150 [Urbifossiella sp.]|nr:hypothetical protein [Urbifossiella sp.]
MNRPSGSEPDQPGDVEAVVDQVFRLVGNKDRAGVVRVLTHLVHQIKDAEAHDHAGVARGHSGPRPVEPCGRSAGPVIGTVTGPLAEVHQSLCVRPLHTATAHSPDWLHELYATIHQLNVDIRADAPFLSSAGGYCPLRDLPPAVALEVIEEVLGISGDGRIRLLAAADPLARPAGAVEGHAAR